MQDSTHYHVHSRPARLSWHVPESWCYCLECFGSELSFVCWQCSLKYLKTFQNSPWISAFNPDNLTSSGDLASVFCFCETPAALMSLLAFRSRVSIASCPSPVATCNGCFPSLFLESTCAPAWSNICTALMLPDLTARCKGWAPVSSWDLISAEFSKRKLRTGPCPCLAAMCKGELLRWLWSSNLAFHLNNWRTTFRWPLSAAACKGVWPSPSRADTKVASVVCVMLRRSFTAATWPPAAAMWKAMRPSPSGIRRFAPAKSGCEIAASW